jgi:hypothetical protein
MSDSTNGPAGFEPIGSKRIKKAKRTKAILIVTIVILVIALGGLAFLGYTFFQEGSTTSQGTLKPPPDLSVDTIVDQNAPGEIKVEITTVPGLASLFGLTVEEVKAKLGSGFQLVKTDSLSDPTNDKIRQLATFSYVPTVAGSTTETVPNSSLPSENLYLSLDEGGKVIDVYYTCDMRLLGYPEKSFIDLLTTGEVVTGALAAAGVEPMGFEFVTPYEDETISYDNVNSVNRKVVKQTTIFSGRTSTETVPTAWTLTVTYDYGSGVAETSDYHQATRTISLRLA